MQQHRWDMQFQLNILWHMLPFIQIKCFAYSKVPKQTFSQLQYFKQICTTRARVYFIFSLLFFWYFLCAWRWTKKIPFVSDVSDTYFPVCDKCSDYDNDKTQNEKAAMRNKGTVTREYCTQTHKKGTQWGRKLTVYGVWMKWIEFQAKSGKKSLHTKVI